MVKETNDPTWDHCVKIGEGKNSRLKLKCIHCQNVYSGGVTRMKHHLARTKKDVAPCLSSSIEVKEYFLKLLDNLSAKKKGVEEPHVDEEEIEVFGLNKQPNKFMMGAFIKSGTKGGQKNTLNTMLKPSRDDVCVSISRCFYANAIPFNLVNSPYFKDMCESIALFGKGLKLPTYYEVREKYLKREVETMQVHLQKYKESWKTTGCTLMSDGWTDGKHRSITNFLVNSPMGTVFLKSVDTSSISHTSENLFELLNSIIDEIGEENVVQVVTDSASNYVKAGELLMGERKKLFWSPCAAHCIDLMLQDIGTKLPTHATTTKRARKVTVYIYTHAWVLSTMREFTKGDLVRAAITRFATSYLTLKSLLKHKVALTAMFGSEKWQMSQFAKTRKGMEVRDIIMDTSFWDAVKYCLACTIPLVKVLRLVDGDAKPAMGYIYEAMDTSKEKIAQNFHHKKKSYQAIWDIIDLRWDRSLHRPLHAAGHFLNPR